MRQKKLTQQQRIDTLERVIAQLDLRVQTNSNILDKLPANDEIQSN